MTTIVTIAISMAVWLIGQNIVLYLWLPRLVRALVEPIAAELRHLGESLGSRLEVVEARTLPLQGTPGAPSPAWGPAAAPAHARKEPGTHGFSTKTP